MPHSYSVFFMINDSMCPDRLSVSDGLLYGMPAIVTSFVAFGDKEEVSSEPEERTAPFRINKIMPADFMAPVLEFCVIVIAAYYTG
jgi:hypothetical protein